MAADFDADVAAIISSFATAATPLLSLSLFRKENVAFQEQAPANVVRVPGSSHTELRSMRARRSPWPRWNSKKGLDGTEGAGTYLSSKEDLMAKIEILTPEPEKALPILPMPWRGRSASCRRASPVRRSECRNSQPLSR